MIVPPFPSIKVHTTELTSQRASVCTWQMMLTLSSEYLNFSNEDAIAEIFHLYKGVGTSLPQPKSWSIGKLFLLIQANLTALML